MAIIPGQTGTPARAVDAEGRVGVRQATIVKRDGEEIARTFHRWLFNPGDDVSAMPAAVQAVCNAVWNQ